MFLLKNQNNWEVIVFYFVPRMSVWKKISYSCSSRKNELKEKLILSWCNSGYEIVHCLSRRLGWILSSATTWGYTWSFIRLSQKKYQDFFFDPKYEHDPTCIQGRVRLKFILCTFFELSQIFFFQISINKSTLGPLDFYSILQILARPPKPAQHIF